MISDLMLYGTKFTLLIGLAALALERVAAWRGLPRRECRPFAHTRSPFR